MKPGTRPPLDLSPVATAIRWVATRSGFEQTLAFERLMAPLVPFEKRRDLKPPAYVHLDPTGAFPRAIVRTWPAETDASCFGPFRDGSAARAAIAALHQRFPLRPCDYSFTPDPAWPTGVGCVYAQVKTCAAPCLGRVSEEAYRGLASQAAGWLAGPRDDDDVAPWVTVADARAVIVERAGEAFMAWPVLGRGVVDEGAAAEETLADTLAGLHWDGPSRDDAPWLSAWLHTRKRSGVHVVVRDRVGLAAAVEAALAAPALKPKKRAAAAAPEAPAE